jgi:hypothetical protein
MPRARWSLLTLVAILDFVGVDARRARAGDEPKPCKLATKGDSPVANACAKGGFKAAKKLMQDMVHDAKKAKDKRELKCDSCHDGVDDGRYDVLRKEGSDRFKDLLSVLEKPAEKK